MASGNVTVTVKMDPDSLAAALTGIQRRLWEAEWHNLTGIPWGGVRRKHTAHLDVTLAPKPWDCRVIIAGTAIDIPVASVSVEQPANEVGMLTIRVPMNFVSVRSA